MEGNDSAERKTTTAHYVLYVFPFSLYSIMARLTAALGAAYHAPPSRPLSIELLLVNLHRDEELAEAYLTQINPKGQVPAMTSDSLPAPLTDSRDISFWFAEEHYPGLLPDPHRPEIETLLADLHAVQAASLSVKEPSEDLQVQVPNPGLDKLLARDDLSPAYKEALRLKKQYYDSSLGPSLRPESVDKARRQATDLFDAVLKLRSPSFDSGRSLWLYGDETGPTVLDAHLAPFIARLEDAGQRDLVLPRLLDYAAGITALPAWDLVTRGRSTLWNVSYGHAHLLEL
ncbi:hypothetical protein VTK73DRAFT_6152 [Phialemonium thermophilum]|uniref:GST N-terminal domain-containing protein n=1 Tax=Phialemonium thermophilum TaxID=223376 RepID=A0ABR3WKU6_9PEZI